MNTNSISNNDNIAKSIRNRRLELNMTIEEAARKAGIGTKTWSRYESGNPIRQDKLKKVLTTLRWTSIPSSQDSIPNINSLISEYTDHSAWSEYINKNHGTLEAISFCMGSDIISDYVQEDLEALSSLPKNSHIGQLDSSFLNDLLPQEYLMNYNYEFIFSLKRSLNNLIRKATSNDTLILHSPIEEILLYIIVDAAELLMSEIEITIDDIDDSSYSSTWIYDVFDDADVELFLYSEFPYEVPSDYQFENWFKNIFYINE